ncbi:hypothetical protein PVAND_009690 [Polypedilum vanderplanki]|uniref:Phosphate transporter n=1 Tax=Polypedilum vanderplanki TaxID=319348 RepID=A0A9J6CE07_POLVA|nr:hypothetical protein PVAND_009690 [Polypedilum vanderplanki]
MEPYSNEVLWIVIVAFIISFILAFGIGANDVANSFATSIGSGVLTLKQACYLATVFEIAGAVLLGYKVSDTIRKGILDVTAYENAEKELMLGMLAALAGCAIWLLIATFLKLPVSTTHSIVGASVGFGLVARGADGIKWKEIITIALSWVISPLMAGIISVVIYMLFYRFILKAKNPFNAGLTALPIIWGVVVFVNVLSITLDGSKLLGMQYLDWWMSLCISVAVAIITIGCVHFFMVPWQRNKILEREPYNIDSKPKTVNTIESGIKESTLTVNTITTSTNSVAQMVKPDESEEKRVNLLFHFIQILAAIFSSFAHGGNDVANAIGPLITVFLIYTEGHVETKAETPIYLLIYGGLGIVVGLWFLGKRVIDTVGFNLTKITPATGVTIESGSAATVLMASKIGVPISTTHCKVGAVALVGWAYGKTAGEKTESVNWKLFSGIVGAWVITLPASGGIAAILMYLFEFLV